MSTKLKGNIFLIRKKKKKKDGVFQGSDSYCIYWGEQWASKVLDMIFKVLETVKVLKENVSAP